MSRFAVSMLALVSLACRPGAIGGDDEVVSSGSSSGSSSGASSSEDGTGASSDTQAPSDGPFPDVPNQLPEGCSEVEFLDAENEWTGMWSGWLKCGDAHFRVEAIDCPFVVPFEACDPLEPECAECLDGESCLDYYFTGYGTCFCGHNCTSDADCGRGEICVCAAGGLTSRNTCLPADCADELDCPAVEPLDVPHCRLSTSLCGSPESVHCRTELDACLYSSDCPDQWCRYDGTDERWTCDMPAICE